MTDSEKLDLIILKLSEHDAKFSEISAKISEHDAKFSEISTKFSETDKKLDKLTNDVTDIKLILENEIRTNIKRVAEGHLDLSRRLIEATKMDNEKEMIAIRVSMLETEVGRLGHQLDQMAG